MSRLTPLRARDVIRKLQRLGFVGPIPGGKHVHMVHPEKGHIIPIPVHGSKEIGVGLIREIIKQVGVSRDEWMAL